MSGGQTELLVVTHSYGDRARGAVHQPAASEAEIRGELKRVIASTEFDASERNRRFLRYVVEETLAGRAERIKAYSIATSVFGRGVDFDPQNDPVVRMEAQRLRRALDRFYLTEGRGSAVRILLPKGGYVPEFVSSGLSRATRSDGSVAARAGGVATLLIRPFGIEADDSGCRSAETGLLYQIMIALQPHRQLKVLGLQSAWPEALAPEGGAAVDFVLTGSWAIASGTLYVKAVLLDARTGDLVWGQQFERGIHPDGVFATRDEIANAIAFAVLGVATLAGRECPSQLEA